MFRPEPTFIKETIQIQRGNYWLYICIIYVSKDNIFQALFVNIIKIKENINT